MFRRSAQLLHWLVLVSMFLQVPAPAFALWQPTSPVLSSVSPAGASATEAASAPTIPDLLRSPNEEIQQPSRWTTLPSASGEVEFSAPTPRSALPSALAPRREQGTQDPLALLPDFIGASDPLAPQALDPLADLPEQARAESALLSDSHASATTPTLTPLLSLPARVQQAVATLQTAYNAAMPPTTLYLPLVSYRYSPPTSVPPEGGVLYSPDGAVTITFGAGALQETASASYLDVTPSFLPPSLAWSGRAFQLTVEGVQDERGAYFAPHVTTETLPLDPEGEAWGTRYLVSPTVEVAIRYDEAQVAGLEESRLRLYRQDPATRAWRVMPGYVDEIAKVVHATIERDGQYALLAHPSGDDGTLVTTGVLTEPAPLVVLDPDHGGADPGGVVTYPAAFAIAEKTPNLSVALLTRDLLQACGVQVEMTRDSDISLSTPARAAIINASEAAAAVTVAFNIYQSWMSPFNGGAMGLVDFDKPGDVAFAEALNAQVANYTGLSNHRGVRDTDTWGFCGGYCVGSMVPTVPYAQGELAFLDSVTDRGIIDGAPDAFAGAVFSAIVNQVGGSGVCVPGFEFPAPLSAEERLRLRNLGLQKWQEHRGDPVTTATGNQLQEFVDLRVPGRGGFDLTLTRTYNSLDGRNGAFGYGWSSLLDMNLRLANDGSVDVRRADGSGVYFVGNGETFTPGQGGVFDTLVRNGPDFLLTTPEQVSYHFQLLGEESAYAWLMAVENRHGNTITLERDGDGRVTQIVDSAGRSYALSYEGTHVSSLTDPAGRTLGYGYDGSGDLVAVTDGNGGVRRFEYQNHWMTALIDPEDIRYLENIYDDQGRVIEQIDASGVHNFFSYEASDQTPFTDNLGQTTNDQFDELFRVTTTTDALGHSEVSVYDEAYNVTSYTDKRGNSWTYSYDERGNLLTQTDPQGHVTSYSYNASNDLLTLTDEGGISGAARTTTFVYDGASNLIRTEQPDGTSLSASYDAHGQMETFTDANQHTTTYAYDDAGNLVEVTDALGHVTRYGYDAVGRMTSMTDANGHVVRFEYDGNDNVLRIVDPKGQATVFEYDGNDNLMRLVDRRGGVTTYGYDENLKLISERDPEGHTTTYDYDAMYNRTSATDGRGNTTLYRYDALYRLEELEDAEGNITRFAYDENGNVTLVTDALGQVTSFDYDEVNRLSQETDALDGVTGYEYDAVGRLVAVTNPRGAVTGYAYDLLDRPLTITDALDGETRYGYDAAGNLTTVTDANGHTTTVAYDAADRPESRTDALGNETAFEYDAVGNLTLVTDALGRQTGYDYDANDNLTTTTDALDGVTTVTYNEEDQPVTLTDANGHTTTFAYTLDGQRSSLTEAGGQVTLYDYDEAHNLVTLTNAKGNSWTFTYDALNRRETERDPLGHTTTFVYDALGRLHRQTDALEITTRYDYDALSRLVAVVQNERSGPWNQNDTNVTTRYDYDAVGNLVTLTDANGNVTTFDYDLLDRLTDEVNPLDHTWHYGYDAVGNLVTRTDAEAQTTDYRYNATNLLEEISYPDGSGVTFGYDAVYNQVTMTDGLGLTENEYDALNRLERTVNHIGQEVGYSYDAVGNRLSISYPDGRTVQYEYDETNFVSDVTDPDGNVFSVTRDATHNVTRLDNPNLTIAEYTFDAAERLTSVHNEAVTGYLITAFDYALDAVGNRTETLAQYREGQIEQVTTAYEYDRLHRLTNSANNQGHFNEYVYDAVGNRLALTTNFDPTRSDTIEVMTTTYSYDGANALLATTAEVEPRGNPNRPDQVAQALRPFIHEVEAQSGHHIEEATATALLDEANALLAALEGTPTPSQNEVAAALAALRDAVEAAGADGRIDNAGIVNSLLAKLRKAERANERAGGALLSTLYEYDRNGNRIRRTMPDTQTGNTRDRLKTEYAYDFENRLAQVQDFRDPGNGNWLPGDETRLSYDGYGRLFRRLHDQHIGGGGQKWVEYVYDGLDPIAEYITPGARYAHFYRGLGRILSTYQGPGAGQGRLYYYHYDGLNSVSAMTKHQGQSAHDYRYADYGLILDNNGHAADASNFTDPHNHYTYTGQEWDEETELLHFYAREYDPAVGVWLQQDPYRGELAMPMTLHRYGYVGGNPIRYVDPLGYAINFIAGAVGVVAGGVIGGTVSAVTQYATTGKVDWKEVGASAAGGAIQGGICGVSVGLGCAIGGGAAGSMTTKIVSDLAHGRSVDWGGVAREGVIGAASGLAFWGGGKVVRQVTTSLKTNLVKNGTTGAISSFKNLPLVQGFQRHHILPDSIAKKLPNYSRSWYHNAPAQNTFSGLTRGGASKNSLHGWITNQQNGRGVLGMASLYRGIGNRGWEKVVLQEAWKLGFSRTKLGGYIAWSNILTNPAFWGPHFRGTFTPGTANAYGYNQLGYSSSLLRNRLLGASPSLRQMMAGLGNGTMDFSNLGPELMLMLLRAANGKSR